MKRRKFCKLIAAGAGLTAFPFAPAIGQPLDLGRSATLEAGSGANPGGERGQCARIVRTNNVPTLEVDGAPFLLVGAQCDIWRSLRQDEKTIKFFDGYQAMNATCVSTGIPWSWIETGEDNYNFQFLDWYLEQAKQRGLKLVLNLFNTNVCGKVMEESEESAYPRYTPAYILESPQKYQRMVLPGPWKYNLGGPPMCPNDPRTLHQERQYCVKLAKYLKRTDADRTVIMLQIDNEFYYQQWVRPRPPDKKAIRCHCSFCDAKWKAGSWKNGEDFMFQSFADYVKELTDSITAVYPLPLYINSPWWPPYVIPIFLERCPNLTLVGIDGVFSPEEPNFFSASQLGRNIPFAAENPTENPKTRLNLDVLPYYTLVGQQGIGNLLWECGPPHTVVHDLQARHRYGAALYPIRWAQTPIACSRGTENFIGWYAIRNIATELTTDIFGNFVPVKTDGEIVRENRLFVRQGTSSRIIDADCFTASLGDLSFTVSNSAAGIIVRLGPKQVVLAIPKGRLAVEGPRPFQSAEGRFEGDRWLPRSDGVGRTEGNNTVFEINEPKVILLNC